MQEKGRINKLFKKREWKYSIIAKIMLLWYLKEVARNWIKEHRNFWVKRLAFDLIINTSNLTISNQISLLAPKRRD